MRRTCAMRVAKMPRCGPAERRRNAQRLTVGHDDVGSVGAGRLEQSERNRIGDDDQQRADAVQLIGQTAHVLELAEEIGALHDQRGGGVVDRGAEAVEIDRGRIVADDLGGTGPAQVGLDHCPVLRMHERREEDLVAFALRDVEREQHRLRQRGGAVIVAAIADLHAGETAHHALKLEHGLQLALADLGLIRRIGGIELATAQHVIDRRRSIMVIRAGAEKARRRIDRAIAGAERLHLGGNVHLRARRRQLQLAEIGRAQGCNRTNPRGAPARSTRASRLARGRYAARMSSVLRACLRDRIVNRRVSAGGENCSCRVGDGAG